MVGKSSQTLIKRLVEQIMFPNGSWGLCAKQIKIMWGVLQIIRNRSRAKFEPCSFMMYHRIETSKVNFMVMLLFELVSDGKKFECCWPGTQNYSGESVFDCVPGEGVINAGQLGHSVPVYVRHLVKAHFITWVISWAIQYQFMWGI